VSRPALLLAAALVVCLGCGRIGFRALPSSVGEAGPDAASARDAAARDAAVVVADSAWWSPGLDAGSGFACAAQDGGACGTGGCLAGECATFGGSFVISQDGFGNRTCVAGNPRAGSACACPAGFAPIAEAVVSSLYDLSDRIYEADYRTICFAAPSTGADFRGAWARIVGGCAAMGCRPNPETGDCTCPAGSIAIASTTSDGLGCDWEQALCVGEGAPRTFAGAYVYDGMTCTAPNPLTGACTCPVESAPVDWGSPVLCAP